MKNRRMIIAAFLCLAMMIVGIGYASLTAHLVIDGYATFDHDEAIEVFEQSLYFDSTTPSVSGQGMAYEAGVVEDVATANAQTANFVVRTLAQQGEKLTFTYDLVNENLVSAKISIQALHEDQTPNPTDTMSYYRINSIKIDGVEVVSNNTATGASYTISAGATVKVTVDVELTQTPTTDVSKESFTLSLHVDSVDATP